MVVTSRVTGDLLYNPSPLPSYYTTTYLVHLYKGSSIKLWFGVSSLYRWNVLCVWEYAQNVLGMLSLCAQLRNRIACRGPCFQIAITRGSLKQEWIGCFLVSVLHLRPNHRLPWGEIVIKREPVINNKKELLWHQLSLVEYGNVFNLLISSENNQP